MRNTKKKKKVLFINVIKVFPASAGGMIRPAAMAKGLSECGYDVDMYSFTARKDDYVNRCSSYSHQPLPGLSEYVSTSFLHFFLHQLFKLIKAPPIWCLLLTNTGYTPKELRKRIKDADFIISEYIFTMAKNKNYDEKTWFVDSHNIEYLRESAQGGIHKFYAKIVYYFERKVSRSYDGVLACTQAEMSFFKDNAKDKFQRVLVPNGIDSNSYLTKCSKPDTFPDNESSKVFLFFGSNYYANKDTAEFLRIFSSENHEWLRENDIFILVAGSVYQESFKVGNFIATSYVNDPLEYYSHADFLLNPMSLGSGSNIKVAQAIAAKLPIVSSVFGMRGFDAEANADYIACDRISLKDDLQRAIETKKTSLSDMTEILREKSLQSIDSALIAKKKIAPLIEGL